MLLERVSERCGRWGSLSACGRVGLDLEHGGLRGQRVSAKRRRSCLAAETARDGEVRSLPPGRACHSTRQGDQYLLLLNGLIGLVMDKLISTHLLRCESVTLCRDLSNISKAQNKCDKIRVIVLKLVQADTTPAPTIRSPPRRATSMQLQHVASRYRIKGKLGRGSMGNVYLAADIRLGRNVALKFLRSELVASQSARHRFETEARRLAGMSNPNLASIHDFGEENGLPYMVLEFIEGVDLERVLKQSRLPVEVAASVILEVLGGIEYAQSLGVVHRDIKPSNIMLTPDGHVKVIDFGIALDENWDMRNTVTGAILCTPAYASPEQAMGLNKQVDKRSDVYSLGAVFFEMLTGQPPLLRENVEETREAHFTESAPPLPAGFDRDLVAVVARSLAKEKIDRYPSAGEFRIALKKALPPDSLDPDLVASYISPLWENLSGALRESDDAVSDAGATILEGGVDGYYFPSTGAVEKTGNPMPLWAIYVSVRYWRWDWYWEQLL
jgi:serine/threonine protein kinase